MGEYNPGKGVRPMSMLNRTSAVGSRSTLLLLLVCLSLSCWADAPADQSANAPPRYALLLVNSDYSTPIDGHSDDLNALMTPLEDLGFDVTRRRDLDRRGMRRAIRDFAATLEQDPTSIGLVYLVAYRVPYRNRVQLLPAGSTIDDPTRAARSGIGVAWVIDELKFAQNKATAVFINGFDLPSAESGATRAADALASIVELDGGVTLAFSHHPDHPVAASAGVQQDFRDRLIASLSAPRAELPGLLPAGAAMDADPSASPWLVAGPDAGVLLAAAPPEPEPTPAPTPAQGKRSIGPAPNTAEPPPDEALVWEVTEDGGSAADYELFLKTFPNGYFADQARAKLAELSAPAVSETATSAPPSAGQAPAAEDPRAKVAWDSVKDSDNPALLALVGQQFPDSQYARLAEQRIAQLESASEGPVTDRNIAPAAPESDAARDPAGDQAKDQTRDPVTDQPAAAAEQAPAADSATVADYLERAQDALDHKRLTTPADNSALHWAEQVLAIDPDNQQARALMEKVVDKYLLWAGSQYRREQITKARRNVGRARNLTAYASPSQKRRIAALDQQIRAWQPPAPEPPPPPPPAPPPEPKEEGILSTVKGWFTN